MSPARTPLGDSPAARVRDAMDLDAEFAAHIAHRVDDLVRSGMSRDEATAQANREFGDAVRIHAASLAVRDEARKKEARASKWDALLQDVFYAVRQLRHRPGFALATLSTLALGVGAAVTIMSVVHAVVLDPLPFEEPDRVVMVEMLTPEGAMFPLSEAVFHTLRESTRSFSGMAAIHYVGATLEAPGEPRTLSLGRVSSGFLETLGMAPALGRSFTEEEDAAGAPAAVAMLSYDTWRTEYAAAPSAIGSTVRIDGQALEVIGVLPEALDVMTGDSPLLAPLGTDRTKDPGDHYLTVVARLGVGASAESAANEVVANHLTFTQTTGEELGWTTRLVDPRAVLIGPTTERAGVILLAAAAVLLAMACANVANLLMVRASGRNAEMAVRVAIGASRGRLGRQLVTESAVLAALGGALGLFLASVAIPLVQVIGASRIPRLDDAELGPAALLIGVATVSFATLVCGLAPAFQLRADARALRSARGGRSAPQQRLRSALAAAQVALTVVLLGGTGLLFRSFLALTSVDPGFEPVGTLAFEMSMPDQRWSWEERGVLVPELTQALRDVPGVTAVGATAVQPFSGAALFNFTAPEDRLPDRTADFLPINWRPVTPGFFGAMGIELIAGRDFLEGDEEASGSLIVIGRSLAERAWGDVDVLGRTLVWGDPDGTRMRVVGVVDDLQDVALGVDPPMIIYRLYQDIPWASMTMVVRHEGDAAGVIPAIRPAVAAVAPDLPIGEIESLELQLSRAVAEPRFNLQVLAAFAIAGLLMALVGLWGVTAFDVRGRFHEIGVRLSLGARPEGILKLVLRSRLRVVLAGLVAGVVLARFAAGAMGTLLYDVEPNDPVTWIAVLSIVIATSLSATLIPARSAMKVDPRDVLGAS